MSLKRTIRELIQVMKDEDLAEIEVRRPFWTVRVRRPATSDLGGSAAAPAPQAAVAPARGPAPAAPATAPHHPNKSPKVR